MIQAEVRRTNPETLDAICRKIPGPPGLCTWLKCKPASSGGLSA